jgi:hypothetical protein
MINFHGRSDIAACPPVLGYYECVLFGLDSGECWFELLSAVITLFCGSQETIRELKSKYPKSRVLVLQQFFMTSWALL